MHLHHGRTCQHRRLGKLLQAVGRQAEPSEVGGAQQAVWNGLIIEQAVVQLTRLKGRVASQHGSQSSAAVAAWHFTGAEAKMPQGRQRRTATTVPRLQRLQGQGAKLEGQPGEWRQVGWLQGRQQQPE